MQFAPSSQTSSGPEQTQEPPGVRRPRACWSSRPPLPTARRGQCLASAQFGRLLLLTLAAAPLYGPLSICLESGRGQGERKPSRSDTCGGRRISTAITAVMPRALREGRAAPGRAFALRREKGRRLSHLRLPANVECRRCHDARVLRVLHSECTEQARDVVASH